MRCNIINLSIIHAMYFEVYLFANNAQAWWEYEDRNDDSMLPEAW